MTLALTAYAEGHPPPLNADARVQNLSGGQQRRLDLALGILDSPRLLFLDEPTTGFDPGARRGAWQLVRDLRDQGTTIVLTTHYLEEAEALTGERQRAEHSSGPRSGRRCRMPSAVHDGECPGRETGQVSQGQPSAVDDALEQLVA